MFTNATMSNNSIANCCAAVFVGVLFMAAGSAAFADTVCGANVNEGGASITIQNNLDKDLTFKETANRQNIELWSDPPPTVKAGESGCFVVAPGDSVDLDQHLNVKYSIDSTDDGVGVVFKHDYDKQKHCPKDHPDSVAEKVKQCGNWNDLKDGKLWTYIFDMN